MNNFMIYFKMIFQESIWHTLTETKILKVFELGIQPSHKLHTGRKKFQTSGLRNLSSISEIRDTS